MAMRRKILAALMMTVLMAASPARADGDFESELKAVRDAWALAQYRTPPGQQEAALEKLLPRSAAFAARYPTRPEALVWDGIVLSTYAGVKGGMGALAPARKSRERFEAALALDENAMEAGAHTSLGVLYHKLPGFPIAFGSDRKARQHLERALALFPDAIDQNYYYAEFLYDDGEYAAALPFLERALKAPPRPGREVAEEGRRAEIQALMARIRKKLD